MNLLWITSSYPRYAGDGAGSFIASLARALVTLGHQVDVVAPHDPAVEPYDQGGVGVHRFRYAPTQALHIAGHGRALHADQRMKWVVPALMPGYCLSAARMARRLARAGDHDLIHGHWAVPGGPIAASVAACVNKPLVVSMHGSDVFVIEHNRMYASVARKAFARAARVTACSEDLRTRAIGLGLSRDKTVRLPYGVDTARYGQGSGAVQRERLGIPLDAPVIGALGRLVAKKGFGTLIEAFSAVIDAHPEAYCVIGGEGDLDQELREAAERLGIGERVRFPGHVGWQDTPDWLAMCDIMTVPSVIDANGNVDGLPNVLLESMASGRPVIGSDVAGIPSVIDDGRNGLLCPPGDAESLAERLGLLLDDPALRRRLGEQARGDMLAAYDWSTIAERMVDIYQQALDG